VSRVPKKYNISFFIKLTLFLTPVTKLTNELQIQGLLCIFFLESRTIMTASCTFKNQNNCFPVPHANSASWCLSKKMSCQLFCWVNDQLNGRGLNWLTECIFMDYLVVFPHWGIKMTANYTLRDQNDCFPFKFLTQEIKKDWKRSLKRFWIQIFVF
jgi:hypothetical protein